jgi:hypothetical protein
VRVDAHRERLLAIKQGDLAWEEIDAWRLDLHRRFETAFHGSGLPERPDFRTINDYLVRARRAALDA